MTDRKPDTVARRTKKLRPGSSIIFKWFVAAVVGASMLAATQSAFAFCGSTCTGWCYFDSDGDGYGSSSGPGDCEHGSTCECRSGFVSNQSDCNDSNASVHPGSAEACNNVDDDCDSQVDENLTQLCGSSTGACSTGTKSCTSGSWGTCQGNVGPSLESCNGADDDCDGSTDEGVKNTYYIDSDGDGFGGSSSTQACSRPSGYVTTSTDCNDSNSSVNPSASETCNGVDDDCDGTADDGDPGGGAGCSTGEAGVCSSGTTVCSSGSIACQRDTAPSTETCDSLDNDCDGVVDDGVQSTYFADSDGDGFGGSSSTQACSRPSGYVTTSSDCNDSNSVINPGATETCNGVDDDCNGQTDDGVQNTYYIDSDGDGFGGSGTTQACSQPSGYVTTSSDCNDSNSSVNPSATETCNGVDDDCDGTADDGDPGGGAGCSTGEAGVCSAGTTVCTGGSIACQRDTAPSAETCDTLDNDCDGVVDDGVQNTYYADTDADSFGDASSSTTACSVPSGYVADNTDCNDNCGSCHPGGTETCDGADNNCDGTTDEGVKTTFYIDSDGDGYGGNLSSRNACSAPTGYADNNTDCRDLNSSINPGETEVCDGTDNNCDGQVDEGVKTTYYADADADGFGDAAASSEACSQPNGYVTDATDCDDTVATTYPGAAPNDSATACMADADGDGYGHASPARAAVTWGTDCDDAAATTYPGATEICDGADNDCDGTTDESVKTTYYADADADGYGVSASTTQACSTPSGYADEAGDCDDADAVTYPGAAFNESSTDCMTDADVDGYGKSKPKNGVTAGIDCNDANATVYPSATEVCDGVDQDCDAIADEFVKTQYFYDTDGDGYGTSTSVYACDPRGNYRATQSGDCLDGDASINPGVSGSCDNYADPFTYAGQPDATFLIGGDIFASGQSNNLGPAANQVLDSYWTRGPCPDTDGDTDTCDKFRFGMSLYADNDCSASINPVVQTKEDGGGEVESAIQGMQNRVGEAFCADPGYRPVDEALYRHQALSFPGGSSADLETQESWWSRPNLNFLVVGDLPQTSDGANDRVESSIQAVCDLYRGDDGTGAGAVPSMPTWVMLSRTFAHDAVSFAGLMAAAGGTGQCCYGYGCDVGDSDQWINVCNHINQTGVTEATIRQDISDGKYNCGDGGYGHQTGGLNYGSDTGSGQLAATRCHLVGEQFNDDCDGNGRQPSDVLGSMSCMRQLPYGTNAEDVHIEYCVDLDGDWDDDDDEDDDEGSVRVCLDLEEGDGLEFVNPPENTLFVITKEVYGVSLCELMNQGVGGVDVTVTKCPRKNDPCQKDGLVGRCAEGKIQCTQEGVEYCQTLYDEMPEVCNGLDDDCDGNIDNLSSSWGEFWAHDPKDLEAPEYSADGLDRSAIHCHERNVCGCRSDRGFAHAGTNFDEYVNSWTDGICTCGEGIEQTSSQQGWEAREPAEASAVVDATPDEPGVDTQAACSATAANRSTGALGLGSVMLLGLGLWWRRRRK